MTKNRYLDHKLRNSRDNLNLVVRHPSRDQPRKPGMIKSPSKLDALLHSTRLLDVGDAYAITQHFLGLPAHDLYLRFCGSISGQSIERFVDRCIVRRDQVFIGYSIGASLIGVAQLAPAASPAAGSELALSVDPGFRRSGVATVLTNEAIEVALERNTTELWISTVSENRPMLQLAKKFGFRPHVSNNAVTGHLCLASGEFATFADTSVI